MVNDLSKRWRWLYVTADSINLKPKTNPESLITDVRRKCSRFRNPTSYSTTHRNELLFRVLPCERLQLHAPADHPVSAIKLLKRSHFNNQTFHSVANARTVRRGFDPMRRACAHAAHKSCLRPPNRTRALASM